MNECVPKSAYSLRFITYAPFFIVLDNFLLAGDKFMPEMHLKPPGFTYSACGPFTKHKQRIEIFMQTGDTNYV